MELSFLSNLDKQFLKPFHEYVQCDYLGVGYEISKPIGSRRNEKLIIN